MNDLNKSKLNGSDDGRKVTKYVSPEIAHETLKQKMGETNYEAYMDNKSINENLIAAIKDGIASKDGDEFLSYHKDFVSGKQELSIKSNTDRHNKTCINPDIINATQMCNGLAKMLEDQDKLTQGLREQSDRDLRYLNKIGRMSRANYEESSLSIGKSFNSRAKLQSNKLKGNKQKLNGTATMNIFNQATEYDQKLPQVDYALDICENLALELDSSLANSIPGLTISKMFSTLN